MQDIYRSTLSLQTYRTWDAVRNVFCHNHRISRVPNSDPQRVAMNVVLKGNAEDDLPAMCLARVAGGRPHPLANLMVGLVLGASPGYFRPGREGAAGAFDPERVRPWSEAAHGWAERTFGDRLVSSVMHLDEVTPHIHLMVFPLDVDGKPRMSSILPNRGALANLHTTYAQALSGLGIGRPVKGGGGGWSGSKDQYWYPYVWTMAFAALPPELLLGSGTVPKLREAGLMHDGAGKARPTSWSPTWLDAERGDGLSADPRKARARLAELQESLDSLRISISRIRREEDVLAASTERDLSLARLVFEPFPYRLVEAASSLWMPVRGTGARHGRAPAGPASADRDRPDLYTADAPSVGHDALDQDSLTVGMGVHIPDGQPVMEEIGCPGDLPAGEELRSPDSQRVREEIGCPGNLPSMEDIRSPDGQPARKGSNRPSGPPVQEGISRTDGQPVYESFGSPSIPQAWAGTGVPINTPARADIRNLGSPQARGDTSGGPINPPATADIRDLGSPQARAGSSGGPTNPPARADIRNLGSPQTLTASGVPSNTPAREYFVGPFTRHGPEAETVPKGGPDRFGGRRQGCGTRPDSSRAVSLGEGLAVTCRRDSWRAVVNGSAGSGMGTVSLMAFLDGTDLSGGAGRELDTACGLADLLGQAGAARALAAHWTASSGKEAARLLEGLLPGPPPSERDWPAAKGRLCAAAGITEAFADRLYREGTLYADHTGAVILSCDAPGTSGKRAWSASMTRTHASVGDIGTGKAMGPDAPPGTGQAVTDEFLQTATADNCSQAWHPADNVRQTKHAADNGCQARQAPDNGRQARQAPDNGRQARQAPDNCRQARQAPDNCRQARQAPDNCRQARHAAADDRQIRHVASPGQGPGPTPYTVPDHSAAYALPKPSPEAEAIPSPPNRVTTMRKRQENGEFPPEADGLCPRLYFRVVMTADGPDLVSLGPPPGYFLTEGGSAGTFFTRNPLRALGMKGAGAPERTAVLPRGRAERSLGREPLPAVGISFDPSLGAEDRETIRRLAMTTATGSAAGVPTGRASAMPPARRHGQIVQENRRQKWQDTPADTLRDVPRNRKGPKAG